MPASPDCQRLSLALLGSLLLHAVWLLPALFSPVPRPETSTSAQNPFVLTTRLSPPAGSQANPEARDPAMDQNQPPPASTQAAIDPNQYYGTDLLTRPPRPLTEVQLDLPEARVLTMPGKLILTLWIDAQGQVTSFQVDAPDLPEEYTTAVAEAFSATRFAPGEIRGHKVSSILKLEISHDAAPGRKP